MMKNISAKRFSNYCKVLQTGSINPNLIKAEYAVRGYIPTLAGKIKEEMKKQPGNFKFNEIVELNIGNPLIFNTNPIWFFRELASELIDLDTKVDSNLKMKKEPSPFAQRLTEFGSSSTDIKKIAKSIMKRLRVQGRENIGGYDAIKESIAKMIHKRDGIETNYNHIFLSNGASFAIRTILELIIQGPSSGILTPVPQYPLYSGLITLFNGTSLPYNLNEEDNWNVSVRQIAKICEDAEKKGITPTAIVLINPGNPTGNVFDRSKMEAILEFASKKNLLILSDEVYQENIYSSKPWYSFRKVLKESPSHIASNVELVSFHSLSKGVLSECGLRGGYMEFTNINKDFVDHFKKYYANVWPNNIGQWMLLMKSMFLSGELKEIAPAQCMKAIEDEYKTLYDSLKHRALVATKLLNEANHMKCNEIEGAMYAFPRIDLPKKMIEKAKELSMVPDVLYCKLMLEESGICIVPGSGFGQEEGTFHFRTTILPSPDKYFEQIFANLKKKHEEIIERYE